MSRKPTSAPPQNRTKTGDRQRDGRFAPGNNANPGGRPKMLAALKSHIQLWGLELVDVLHSIARGEPQREKRGRRTALIYPSARERVLAAKELLDRGYGRPLQAVEISGPGGGALEHRDISQMNSSERRKRLQELLAKAGGVAAVAAVAAEEADGDDDGAGAMADGN